MIRVGMLQVKTGLIICGIGETIADAGAWIAGCRRLHSHIIVKRDLEPHFKTNGELDEYYDGGGKLHQRRRAT